MEDLDPPREQPGAADQILRQLETHGLNWDGEICYQSKRSGTYLDALATLDAKHLTYYCNCTRARLRRIGGIYDRHCASLNLEEENHALRIRVSPGPICFDDLFCGSQTTQLTQSSGDYVLRRRDRLFAYALAVTVDDRDQAISHVIRGRDLLSETSRQLYLFDCLDAPRPEYGHLPVALNSQNQKLSKQNLAPALLPGRESENLWLGLRWLGQQPPETLRGESAATILAWGVSNWQRERVPAIEGAAAPQPYLEPDPSH